MKTNSVVSISYIIYMYGSILKVEVLPQTNGVAYRHWIYIEYEVNIENFFFVFYCVDNQTYKHWPTTMTSDCIWNTRVGSLYYITVTCVSK